MLHATREPLGPRAEADRDLPALVHGRPAVGGEEPVEEQRELLGGQAVHRVGDVLGPRLRLPEPVLTQQGRDGARPAQRGAQTMVVRRGVPDRDTELGRAPLQLQEHRG